MLDILFLYTFISTKYLYKFCCYRSIESHFALAGKSFGTNYQIKVEV